MEFDTNGDTAYVTQLKEQKSKGDITFAAHRHNVNVTNCFKLEVFNIYICCFITPT